MKSQESLDAVRFAVIGDVEPKPDPVFAQLENSVHRINQIHAQSPLDFVAGIGDIPHKGTVEQYENATSVLSALDPPLFAIMGNEEMAGGVERFYQYAAQWRKVMPDQINLRFVKTCGNLTCIFITASVDGVKFSDDDMDWLEEQITRYAQTAILLFTHAPAKDVYNINQNRAIQDERFAVILQHPALRLHFSGHTHIDPDFAPTHVIDSRGLHHVHVPGIERTKVGNKHTPRLRFVELQQNGAVDIQTFNLETQQFDEAHRIKLTV